MIRAIVRDRRDGVAVPVIARRFHLAIAACVVDVVERLRERTGIAAAALGGGVFVNAILLECCMRDLRTRGFTVHRPRRVPTGDGRLCLGQLAIALARVGA